VTSIRIGSETYSLEDSISQASLGDLFTLKVQTRKDGSPGVSVKTISETFTRLGEKSADPDFTGADLLDDDVFIENMIGVVFLARRNAGENITLEDARGVSFNDIAFIVDEEDEDAAPLDVAAGSAPAA